MISVWNLENTHSSNISETLLNHIQTGSWSWLVCRMGAVGVWRIIPRIRTALKPFDHQIHHHRGWTPSYRCTKPAWDLTICHYLRSKTYLAPVGRLTKQLWELVNFVYPRGEKKKLRPTGGDAENQLGGKLVDAGGSMLTATARPSIPGFFGAANCFSLNISLGVNVRENSSMLKQEHYPYCILFYNIQDSHPGP